MLVDMELHKAQRLRYCISVLCVGASAIAPELSPFDLFLEHFQKQLRTTDAIALLAAASLAVLLVDADWSDVPSIMRRITTKLGDGCWSAGGVSYPRTNWGVDDILRQATRLMERARNDPVKRLYLA
jgi:hypothetical protein